MPVVPEVRRGKIDPAHVIGSNDACRWAGRRAAGTMWWPRR